MYRDPVVYLTEDDIIDDIHDFAEAGITESGWYFWTETWADAEGPFASEAVAREELQTYVETMLLEVTP